MRRLDDLGIMINGSFVFGLDSDDPDVFARTVDWGVEQGITTATFHILTPYPGTALFTEMEAQGRIVTRNWDLYDTRHVVYRPSRLSPEELKRGYDWAYEAFYRWSSIFQAAAAHRSSKHKLKHFFYSAGWKKFEGPGDSRFGSSNCRRYGRCLKRCSRRSVGGQRIGPRRRCRRAADLPPYGPPASQGDGAAARSGSACGRGVVGEAGRIGSGGLG